MKLIIFYWIVRLTHTQPPPSLSLPARITVTPSWHSLPLSQPDIGLLFTNSSPFSSTQALLLTPPLRAASRPALRASVGAYSVTQLVSDQIAPLSAPVVASVLSQTVVREWESEHLERFKVRVLFHVMGDPNKRTCVTLHAFKQTEEQKASCITKPPLGLCVVTMTLPKEWFESEQTVQSVQRQTFSQHHPHRRRSRIRSRHSQQNFLKAHWTKSGTLTDIIQLYYTSYSPLPSLNIEPPKCVKDQSEQTQRKLYYIGSVTLKDKATKSNKSKQEFSCLNGLGEEELWLNSYVLIRYDKGPIPVWQSTGLSVNLRSNFSGNFIIVRLKVKKGLLLLQVQPAMKSDLWSVKVERTSGTKHDTISIISHRTNIVMDRHRSSALRQVGCLSVKSLRRSFEVAMMVAASWWVEYSQHSGLPQGAVTSFLSFTERELVGIAPITESNTIINTAILTSQPVSIPVTVLGVVQDETVQDITAAVTCQSASEDIIKVSSDCSAVFVDGSEAGLGSTCVEVEFSLGVLRGTLCLAVWAPMVPLRISLSDSVLSPIEGWSYYTDIGCTPVYQRSTIQVLAQFSAQKVGHGRQPTYMLGSPDWFVDVTNMVHNWLRIENPRIAALDKQGNLIGLQPGMTSLHVISSQWDGVLGSVDVIVTSEPVAPVDLSVQLVGGLDLSINSSPFHPYVVTATVTSHNTLYNHGQEAAVSIWLQFRDDTAIPVSAFNDIPFNLSLHSLAESVVLVTSAPSQRVLAQGEGGGPLVKAELLVSTCELVSNHIETYRIIEEGGTRSLAKGSGWIRVNLHVDLWPLISEGVDFAKNNTADMFVESDRDIHSNSGEEKARLNSSDHYNDSGGFSRKYLERTVLTSNHEERAVRFSPGVDSESEGRTLTFSRAVEVGGGAVSVVLCLLHLVLLIN